MTIKYNVCVPGYYYNITFSNKTSDRGNYKCRAIELHKI